jgi:uncharacterized protein
MQDPQAPSPVESAPPTALGTTVPATAAPVAAEPVDVPLQVARDLGLLPRVVRTVLALMADGGTVPFIARYRKEQTGGLDEVQIRAIEERQRRTCTELEERRAGRSLTSRSREQGKLTPELAAKLARCDAKAQLEDLYAPYRPRAGPGPWPRARRARAARRP